MHRCAPVLLLIFLLALGLRVWRLGEAPPGFNQDEAANAFDPLSLWHTGETHSGDRWPLFFDMYGDYNEGLYYYLNLPFYVVLGNRPAAARLPIALVGALAVLALYFAVRQVEERATAILSAALLAVSPWAIMASRVTLREMLLPAVWFLGLGYFLGAVHRNRSLVPAGFWLGLAFYTYTPVRLFAPFMVGVLLVAYRREMGRMGRMGHGGEGVAGAARCATTAGIVFVGVLAPFFYWMAFRTHDLLARASAVDVFEPGRPFVSSLAEFIVNWVRHYDPRYLFFSGGDEPLFTLPGWGILFAWTAPFVLIGFLHVCRRRNAWDGVLLSWMLFYPVADALTVFAPHPQRAIAGVGLYEILAARGLVLAFGFLRRRRPRWAPAAAMLVVLAAGWQLSAWAREYFGPYRLEYARRCYYGLDRVFKSSYLEGEETVVVTQRIHRGPMQVFYHRNLWGPWRERAEERPLTPALSLRERGEERQQAAALQNTRYAAPTHDRWGRFAFGEPFLLDYPGAVYVLHSEERGLLPALDVIRDPRGAVLWAIVSDEALHAHAPWLADGSPVLQLLDVELSRTHARVGESLAVRYRLALVGECSEPLAWATHFFSGETLWPHNVTMELEHVPLGKSFDVVVETVVPEYAGPGEYRIFAGPYRAADEARLRDAWGADFHAVGRLTIAAGTPAGDGKYAWEREGRALLEMTPPSLPERRLARGERFVLRSEIECPEALDDPVELVVSFFTHGGQWDERRWLARGRHGREMIEIATRVPGNARAGPYSVHVGLYDPARERMLLSRDGLRRLETGRMHVAGRRRE